MADGDMTNSSTTHNFKSFTEDDKGIDITVKYFLKQEMKSKKSQVEVRTIWQEAVKCTENVDKVLKWMVEYDNGAGKGRKVEGSG